MTHDQNIAYWRELKRAMSGVEFVEDFSHPFLLRRRMASSLVQQQVPPPSDWSDEIQYNTAVVDIDAIPTRVMGRITGAKIVPVVKSDRNPFSGQISVGRAKNCDIILRDSSVSKHHAYFRVIDGSSAELIDMRSQNLTRVNDKLLRPNDPFEVTSGDSIVFGGVVVQFINAERLYQLL